MAWGSRVAGTTRKPATKTCQPSELMRMCAHRRAHTCTHTCTHTWGGGVHMAENCWKVLGSGAGPGDQTSPAGGQVWDFPGEL